MNLFERALNEVEMIDFHDSRQSRSFSCGAAALQSVLVYYGIDVREYDLMKVVNTNKNGTTVAGIKKALDKYELKHEEGTWSIEEVKGFIDKEIPVILLIQAWSEEEKDYATDKEDLESGVDGHYVVAIGYDEKNIYFDDPSIHSQRGYISLKELPGRWYDVIKRGKKKKEYKHWGLAIYGKDPKFSSKKQVRIE